MLCSRGSSNMKTPMSTQAMVPRESDRNADLFMAAVWGTGAVVLLASLHQILDEGLQAQHLAWLALAALTLVAGPLSITLPLPNCKISFSDAFIFLALLAFGPPWAIFTGALDGFAASARRGGAWYKRLFNMTGMATSVYASSTVFTWLLRARGLNGSAASAVDLVLPLVALALVQYLVNTALVSTVVALKEHVSPRAIWRKASPWAGIAYLASSAAAAVALIAIQSFGPVATPGVLLIPVILYFTYHACLNRMMKAKRATTT